MELADIGRIAQQVGLSPMGAMVAMAIAKTENGLNGAVGDNGQSFGPFQFYTGGELKNFARDMGVTMAEAGRIARSQPELAAQWALQGYLGDAIRSGERQGISGAALATYAQKFGQRSIEPQRSGTNYSTLFGDYTPSGDQQMTRMPDGWQPKGRAGSDTPMSTGRQQTMQRLPDDWTPTRGSPQTMSDWPWPGDSGSQMMRRMPDDWAPGQSSWGKVAARSSQFGNPELSWQEAKAWCGPAAAMAFAQSYGRTPTLAEAKQLAQSVGWTAAAGMAGPQSTSRLISAFGVPNEYEDWGQGQDWGRVQSTVGRGKPVILSTPGHYFYATQYDPNRDSYYVGTSGTDLIGGKDWLTPKEMQGFGVSGPFQGAIFGS